MGQYLVRRILLAIPTLIVISFVIFAVLELAPGDPTGALPETIRPEVRAMIREAMGLDKPMPVKYVLWLKQFFYTEPMYYLQKSTGIQVLNPETTVRLTSWGSRGAPVFDLVAERIPQTLWVVGLAYLVAILIAVPVGVISAVRQYSIFDQVGTFFSLVGYSIPTFFTGLLFIIIFSVKLGWFPSIYDTNLKVTDWNSFVAQLKQMIMPVMVLALFQAAALARFTRSSMLDNLPQDYVRTARAKGFRERYVVVRHVLRNSLIPVVTLIALGIPAIFGGAIITEQIFRVNGLGALLINAIYVNDIPLIQTVTFMFAFLIVMFNLVADIVYGFLDPRIRYD
ncbi:MAG: ABC transporter permease [Caldilineaceae bacterium]|nr:ABC transporter permease [Caldilineaceae bacterium]MCB9161121.1 ABC transporter permease [Caldilineaceae bacterium]